MNLLLNYKGDANSDGIRNDDQDEFIEIVNLELFAVDVSFWELWDERGPRDIIPGGTILGPGEGLVSFGGGEPRGVFGGAIVRTSSQGNYSFGDDGENVSIRAGGANASGAIVDDYTYTGEEGTTLHSIQRRPDLVGEVFVDHATIAPDGAFFSPGARVDGTPFFNFDDTLSLSFESDSVAEDAASITGTVSLTSAAPVGGVEVSLSAHKNADELSLPDTVTILEGATEAQFTANPVNDGILDGDREVGVHAEANLKIPAIAYLNITEVEPDPFSVVINEVAGSIWGTDADFNQNGDFEEPLGDQFIEIANTGDSDVNLGGWTLNVDRTSEPEPELVVHTFPSGTILAPQGSLVVFGDGDQGALQAASEASFGGATIHVANGGGNGVNLTDDGDGEITLFTPDGFNEDRVTYDENNSDQLQSLTRSPDLSGDFPALHLEESAAFSSLRRASCSMAQPSQGMDSSSLTPLRVQISEADFSSPIGTESTTPNSGRGFSISSMVFSTSLLSRPVKPSSLTSNRMTSGGACLHFKASPFSPSAAAHSTSTLPAPRIHVVLSTLK